MLLSEHGIAHAVIGAAALAVHGVSRATADLDLLALDPVCLDPATWRDLRAAGLAVDVRHGDADDPLAGLVRITDTAGAALDLVLGKSAWQRGILARAQLGRIAEVELPVATAADLILLKLYAGGPQDLWDVHRLLEAHPPELVAEVEERLAVLPADCARLWQRVAQERSHPS